MARRRAFYSFHFKNDASRASLIRNLGVVEGNRPATDNQWEAVKQGGAARIRSWIDSQLVGKSVAIVLIGESTAGRKWIDYEVREAWNRGKGVFGIYVHKLKDFKGSRSKKGANPFKRFDIADTNMARIVKAYDPSHIGSKRVYAYIHGHIAAWIEEAIQIRKSYDVGAVCRRARR